VGAVLLGGVPAGVVGRDAGGRGLAWVRAGVSRDRGVELRFAVDSALCCLYARRNAHTCWPSKNAGVVGVMNDWSRGRKALEDSKGAAACEHKSPQPRAGMDNALRRPPVLLEVASHGQSARSGWESWRRRRARAGAGRACGVLRWAGVMSIRLRFPLLLLCSATDTSREGPETPPFCQHGTNGSRHWRAAARDDGTHSRRNNRHSRATTKACGGGSGTSLAVPATSNGRFRTAAREGSTQSFFDRSNIVPLPAPLTRSNAHKAETSRCSQHACDACDACTTNDQDIPWRACRRSPSVIYSSCHRPHHTRHMREDANYILCICRRIWWHQSSPGNQIFSTTGRFATVYRIAFINSRPCNSGLFSVLIICINTNHTSRCTPTPHPANHPHHTTAS
jgi:hypothetical protein